MIAVVGGVYRERCIQPRWDALFGSAGRAAAALAFRSKTRLVTYVDDASRRALEARTGAAGIELDAHRIGQTISFDYVHPLSVPVIQPPPQLLAHAQAAPLTVREEIVLRFGMMEATAIVEGDRSSMTRSLRMRLRCSMRTAPRRTRLRSSRTPTRSA